MASRFAGFSEAAVVLVRLESCAYFMCGQNAVFLGERERAKLTFPPGMRLSYVRLKR